MIEVLPGGAVRLHLLIQPNASKSEVSGPHDGSLKIRIQSPPIDGKANETLVEFLAKKLGVSKRSVQLVKGETSRHKVVEITGLEIETLKQKLGIS
ncbi:MAG: YggU family protein [Bdellovibrionaceae bacterium]|nr:YggU family protein [Pseudobdellovibrionaceae bacterium]